MPSALTVDRHDAGVVLLTLALPDKRNAMTAELTEQWGQTVASLEGDRSVRCVVVTGADKAFELAKVTRETPDPPDGRFFRGANGEHRDGRVDGVVIADPRQDDPRFELVQEAGLVFIGPPASGKSRL